MVDPLRQLPTVQAPGVVSGADFVSGAASAGQAAANTFRTLSNTLGRVGARLEEREVDEAQREGRDAGLSGTGEERDGRTRSDRAYNAALRSGQIARGDVEADREFNRIAEEAGLDDEAFTANSEAYIERAIAEAPESVATELEFRLRYRQSNVQSRIRGAATEAARREAQESLELSYNQANRELVTMLERDPGAMDTDAAQEIVARQQAIIDELVANPYFGWSEERGEQAMEQAMLGAEEAVMNATVSMAYDAAGGGPAGELAALEAVDSLLLQQDLSTQERLARRSRLQGRIQTLSTQESLRERARQDAQDAREAELERQANEFVADIQTRFLTGEPVTAEDVGVLENLRAADLLEFGQYNTLLSSLSERRDPQPDPALEEQLFQQVSEPMPEDDLNEVLLQAVTSGSITPGAARTIRQRWETRNDARLRSGMDILDAYFTQSAFDMSSDIQGQKTEAESDLFDWVEAQEVPPSRAAIEQRARTLAQEAGRSLPRPPLPIGLTEPMFGSDPNEFFNSSLDRLDGLFPENMTQEQSDQYNRAYEMLESYRSWITIQQEAARGSMNADQ